MSILSSLGKIGKAALNIGTGGVAGTIMDAVGDVASVGGKQLAGQSAGKVQQAQANLTHDRNAIDLYQAQQAAQNAAAQTDLQRKNFETGNRSSTAKQALIGALLGGGVAPTKIGPSGSSGGLMAALQANPEALAAMKTMGTQGAGAQASPLQFTGGQIMTAPKMSAAPEVDNGGFLATLANIGQLAAAARPDQLLKKKPAPMNEDPQGGLY